MTQSKAKNHPSKQNIKVAVDNCIFTVRNDELYVLLIQMKKKPYAGNWALPGGLIQQNETPEDAARRILKEETNVTNVYLEQLYTFGERSRDPFGRVISVAYFALIPIEGTVVRTNPKYADVRWWCFKNLPKLAYDHNEIAKYAKQRLGWKVEYTNVAWSFLPAKFSLSELQKIYEAILGEQIDKRNFRKKIMKLGLIQKVGEKARGAHRPAMLFKFKSKQPKIVEIL